MAKNNSASTMAKNTMLLMLISAIGVVLSFAKESIVAYFFGTSATVDAYVVAVDLPVSLFSLISMALSVVVIPNYTMLRTIESEKAAARFFSNLATLLILVCCGILLILELLGSLVIFIAAPGLAEETHALATKLFRIALPTSVLLLLIKANTGVMNSHKSFALPALGDSALSAVFMVTVALLATRFGIYAAVLGTLLGAVIELIYSSLLRRKYVKYRPLVDTKDPYVRKSVRMVIPVFIGNSIEEINKLVNKIIASSMNAGSISALHYASKISSGVSNLLITGISTVFYPEFAEKAAKKDDEGMAQIYSASVSLFLLIILPLIFGGFFLKEEIVSIVYGRGAFDEESMAITAPLLAGYLLALLFTSVRQSSTNFFNALGETKTPVINSSIGIGINIVLNFILAHFMGVIGLVVATVISSAISAVLLLIAVKKRNSFVNYRHNLLLLVKGIGACLLMVAVLFGVRFLFGLLLKDISSGMHLLLYTLSAIALGAAAYAVGLIVLRVGEVRMILNIIKNKKRK